MLTGLVLLSALVAQAAVPVFAGEVIAQATGAPNSGIQNLPYPGHFFTIQLETDKKPYHLGERIYAVSGRCTYCADLE